MTIEEIQFLKESNAIEGVYDADSLMQAIYAWEYLKGQKEMTSGVILKTHKILMLHQSLPGYQRGYFRTEGVMIGGRLGMSHENIREAIGNWCGKTMTSRQSAKKLHIEYEKIHPFIDGNGRTGRMFLNWTRLKKNQSILVIHEGKEQMEYYNWFD
ncbi:MAG TPA: Fic family protein [bacterium]|nr:Fic family protein [bacterium]